MQTLKFVQLYLQMMWLAVSLGHIIRLPCKSYGNFTVMKKDAGLVGHVLSTFENLAVEECEFECKRHPSCRSIKSQNTNGVNCILYSKSSENPLDGVLLSPSPGWNYKTTNYTAKNFGELCQAIQPCRYGQTCTDSCVCPGYYCQETPNGPYSGCQEAYEEGNKITKVYPMYIEEVAAFTARCDMTTDGGGWMLFQRHVDNTVDFFRDWADYKNGFGDLNGNFWLGLEKLRILAAPGKRAILRVDLKHMDHGQKKFYAEYSTFEIGSKADDYRLKIAGYSGDAGDSFKEQNNMKFSTKDQDHDANRGNCAEKYKGGWWYNACHKTNLNGLYPTNRDTAADPKYMSWFGMKDSFGKVTFSEMKLKYP